MRLQHGGDGTKGAAGPSIGLWINISDRERSTDAERTLIWYGPKVQ
jgi:hypothetical protein